MFRISSSSFLAKVLAIGLIELMLFECFLPTAVYGLTSGPSQPEFSTFSPAGVSNMVNPFTGDFSYNIDLLSVPGFENGYPLNLSYSGGVSMEQEASWVGLGWSLNTGAINRQLRGLPDDFNGDIVKKGKYIKPNRTISLGTSLPPVEGLGVALSKALPEGTLKGYYNNYTGVGYSIGATYSLLKYGVGRGRFNSGISLTYDSQSGFSAAPNASFDYQMTKSGKSHIGLGLSMNFSSREGVSDLSFEPKYTKYSARYTDEKGNVISKKVADELKENGSTVNKDYQKNTAGMSFASAAPVSGIDFPRTGTSFSVRGKVGGALFGVTLDTDIEAFYSSNWIKDNEIQLPALGYFHSEKKGESGIVEKNYLMDFHRDKDIPVTKTSKVLPVTIADNDIFNVSAQGIGAMVRAYRSDVGFYTDPLFHSSTTHIGAGVEVDFDGAPGTKAGLNSLSVQTSNSHSGGWSGGKGALTNSFSFEGKKASNQVNTTGFYEPVFFKSAGELTPDYDAAYGENHLYSNDAHRIEIRKESSPLGALAIVKGDVSNQKSVHSNLNNYTNKRGSRVKRVTEYQFLTRKEAGLTVDANRKSHHIGNIIAVQPGGKRYEFGMPLYNMDQQEVAFAVGRDYTGTENGITSYAHNDASGQNQNGRDQLYQYTKLPPYAHSFLISKIKSLDYVDLTGNGCSMDDFGSYVNFSYTNVGSNYRWRTPYDQDKCSYSPGYLSSKDDDKGSFTYGEKEIRYLKEIETKTHLVKFVTSNREDAIGVAGLHGGKGGTDQKKKKLDKIILYKKPYGYSGNAATLIPVKTVHFEYTYDLCKNVPNNSGATVSDLYNGATNKNGKLTLKRVWFSYMNNESTNSKLADYVFDYGESSATQNPDYSQRAIDRWGNYQKKRFDGTAISSSSNTKSYPYTFQGNTDTEQQDQAGAWSIKKIKLPSGGEIDVTYEMDDYQYVQNRKAMMMAKIEGFSKSQDHTTMSNGLANNTRYVFVKIPGTLTNTEVKQLFTGVNKLYFKVYTALKKVTNALNYTGLSTVDGNGMAYDYVEGYANVDTGVGLAHNYPGYTLAYVKIKRVDLNDSGVGDTCPIRKAGFQHIRMNRGDLLNNTINIPDLNSPMSILGPVMNSINVLKDAAKLIAGFNSIASISYCKSAKLSDPNHPSYVRINAPGIKYGGGYRVKRITMNDNWDKLSTVSSSQSFSYGQEFIYRLEDGSSSGVATYEPLIGGEENPFKRPIYYGPVGKFYARSDAFYVEEPLGESFFPAPVVGYSKVITKTIDHTDVKLGKSGITINEYYTAKDYPVITSRTGVQSKENSPKFIFVPILGSYSFTNNGFSQGISVQLNNMHGKEKTTSTYRYYPIKETDEVNDLAQFKKDLEKVGKELPTARMEYYYQNKDDKPYDPNVVNEIRATVDVLKEDGSLEQKEMGKSVDFYGSMRENYTKSVTNGFQPNAHAWTYGFLPTVIPMIGASSGTYREVTTTKVIARNGLLKKTVAYDGYAKVETENMIFDKETGEVLLAKSNNAFKQPIYSYSIPGYRYYPAFKGAYENIGAEIKIDASGNGITTANIGAFRKGDEILNTLNSNGASTRLWVDNVTSSSVVFKDASGTVVTPTNNSTLKVIRSGNYNLQPLRAGSIVALQNPYMLANNSAFVCKDNVPEVDVLKFNLLVSNGAFNQGTVFADQIIGGNLYIDEKLVPKVASNGLSYSWDLVNSSGSITNGLTITFTTAIPQSFKNATLEFPNGIILNSASPVSVNLILNGVTKTGKLTALTGRLQNACPYPKAKVLNSEAKLYKDNITIEYKDFLRQQLSGSAYSSLLTKINANPYKYGKKGIWRVYTPLVHRTKRDQTTSAGNTFKTNISQDGNYQEYNWFDYASGTSASINSRWIPKGEVTLMSPYGHQLESKDPNKIYSSALYGYNNLLPVAVAANAEYKEIAFEGFEDYAGTVYPTANMISHGHLQTTSTSGSISTNEAHTGKSSLFVKSSISYYLNDASIPSKSGVSLKSGQKYHVSMWVKKTGAPSGITATTNYPSSPSVSYDHTKTNIEGWQQLHFVFEADATAGKELTITGTNFYVDDIRIVPDDGKIVSYVYDKNLLRLMAVLDEQNYATIYNYDNEGNLSQVKKETERGIMTLKSGRIATKKKLNP